MTRTLLGAVLASAALVVMLAPAAHARDPWRPYPPSVDRPLHDQPPPGWVDVRTPVVVQPRGRPRVATTTRTSIVVVMLDDLPEMDLRIWERLPTIRRLFLEEGLRFTRAYGNDPLCCPGRANTLTGLTTDHHGVYTNDATLFDPRVTVATELDARGYWTFMAGKYLNGKTGTIDRRPPGWDRLSFNSNAYYEFTEYLNGRTVYHDTDPEDFQPDLTFNRAIGFLRKAPPDQPVFAYLAPHTVHLDVDPHREMPPHQPVVAMRFWDDPRCDGVEDWVTPAHGDDLSDRPVHQQGASLYTDGYPLGFVCRSLLSVDHGLSRLVTELKAQRRFRNTLFVLIGDNGMGYGAHGHLTKQRSFTTQVPLFVRWAKGRGIAPGSTDAFVSNVDIAATLCAAGGCAMGPYADGRERPDGVSLLPLITGEGSLVRQAIYSEHLTGTLWRAIRTTPDSPLGLWHYARYSTGEVELYDARGGLCWSWHGGEGDPCELTNLAGRPELAETEAALAALLDQAIATGGGARAFRGRIVER
jgi:arylsulfatase A-like enzyme